MTIDCRRWNVRAHFFVIAAASCFAGCRSEPETGRDANAIATQSGVVATTPAIFWMASRMLPDRIPVWLECPERPDESEWTPSADSIRRMQRADVVFLAGAGEERWLQGVTIPERRLIDLSAVVHGELIPLSGDQSHQHGPGGAKARMEWERGVFWDPSLLNRQATEIRNRLTAVYPQHREGIEAGFLQVRAELSSLSDSLRDSGNSAARVSWLDPSGNFRYLPRAAGGADNPGAGRELAKLLDTSGRDGETSALSEFIKQLDPERAVVLIPSGPQFEQTATRLAEAGLAVARLDSGVRRLTPEKFIELYRNDIKNLVAIVNSLAK